MRLWIVCLLLLASYNVCAEQCNWTPVPEAEAREVAKSGSARSLRDTFRNPHEIAWRKINSEDSVSEEYRTSWCESIRPRLADKDPEVRAMAIVIISSLDNKAAIDWATDHVRRAEDAELNACLSVLVARFGSTVLPNRRVVCSESDATPAAETALKAMLRPPTRVSLKDLSSSALGKLLESDVVEIGTVRDAIRARASGHRSFPFDGISEQALALSLLDARNERDMKILLSVARSGEQSMLRAKSLKLLRTGASDRDRDRERVVKLARDCMADVDERVRFEAHGCLDTKEQFEWYRAHLSRKEAAGCVLEHLRMDRTIEQIVGNPSKYPFLAKFTQKQIQWLFDAGLDASIAKKWMAAVSTQKD